MIVEQGNSSISTNLIDGKLYDALAPHVTKSSALMTPTDLNLSSLGVNFNNLH